ncbi:molybdopterin molybdotransferase MoeA [Chryseobacterium sp.]|uniref:molybdopterin molybdotransferase MoeA n=1 Tax=Chryseobacterium sp. TaxID=1871047 RepID=UPI00289A0813|nr:molybdopterin molybdotransferase MoeA [Chryseobacterium sp.]
MISVEEALLKIKENANEFNLSETISLETALGRVLAEDIFAPISIPPFRQSIMDGYAICSGENFDYRIVGETKTGESSDYELKSGEAIRIFTGAQVPETADIVVMQEQVKITENGIQLEKIYNSGENIRNVGEQIKEGEKSFLQGEKLNPSALGILMSFGLKEVNVLKKPAVSIIATGNELVDAGENLEQGQIYESNSHVISNTVKQKGFEVVSVAKVKDSLEDTENAIKEALLLSDIVLISGGISVGDYDFVERALQNLEVEQIFYKVSQKPGKPLYFGKKDNKYVFALPGNPASTLTCLYIYFFELADLLMNRQEVGLTKIQFPISEALENNSGRALFLKAKLKGDYVEILTHQNSSMLLSFARADALVYIPADVISVKKGEPVTTLLLPSQN